MELKSRLTDRKGNEHNGSNRTFMELKLWLGLSVSP